MYDYNSFSFFCNFLFISSTSIVQFSKFTFTMTGFAPTCIIEFILATNVRSGTKTSSPPEILSAFNANIKATEPLDTDVENFEPLNLENSFSNFLT